jgi:predicted ATP-grasp superfamily ATP-dependent carboligase
MSRARELAVVVSVARRDILNRETIRQCRMMYQAIMEQAEQGAKLGAYNITGRVDLDPNERYDTTTITNQLKLKLMLEEFDDVAVVIPEHESFIHFCFTIPEVQPPLPQMQEPGVMF